MIEWELCDHCKGCPRLSWIHWCFSFVSVLFVHPNGLSWSRPQERIFLQCCNQCLWKCQWMAAGICFVWDNATSTGDPQCCCLQCAHQRLQKPMAAGYTLVSGNARCITWCHYLHHKYQFLWEGRSMAACTLLVPSDAQGTATTQSNHIQRYHQCLWEGPSIAASHEVVWSNAYVQSPTRCHHLQCTDQCLRGRSMGSCLAHLCQNARGAAAAWRDFIQRCHLCGWEGKAVAAGATFLSDDAEGTWLVVWKIFIFPFSWE